MLDKNETFMGQMRHSKLTPVYGTFMGHMRHAILLQCNPLETLAEDTDTVLRDVLKKLGI
jgi:hypothetical protein